MPRRAAPAIPELLTGAVVPVCVAAAVFVGVSTAGGSVAASTDGPGPLASRELTGPAPWPRTVRHLPARLTALGVAVLNVEGEALHTHEHLTCRGGYCEGGAKRLWVFVDRCLVRGDPRGIPLEDRQAIVVPFGKRAQLPGAEAS